MAVAQPARELRVEVVFNETDLAGVGLTEIGLARARVGATQEAILSTNLGTGKFAWLGAPIKDGDA